MRTELGLLLIFLIPYFLYTYIKILHGMHMLQQNFYNESNRYVKWIFKNKYRSLITIDLFAIVIPIIFLVNNIIGLIVAIVFYSIIFAIKYKEKKNEQVKIGLVYTSRVKRLVFTTFLLYGLLFYFYHMYINNYFILMCILITLSILAYFITYIAYFLNLPIERMIYNKYKRRAIKKLREMNTINIGITGSYGKTSSKHILNDILSIKYLSYMTPGNYNTPLGIMKTVNNLMDKFQDVFIAEISISAPETHDIERSCEIVKPKYGIITNIGLAHLDSFKTQENIQKAKFKLIEALPTDGLGILNSDDPNQVSYKIKNNCRIKWIGIDNKDADIVANNIKLTHEGTEFDATFKDDNKTIHLKTCLFEKPNIYNILAALLLAKELKLTYDEMIRGVASIKPIEHRLQLKKLPQYTIIDDAYNSNPVGSKMALDVLNLMPGQKIVVTPGMIELKDKEYELNYEFGKHMASVADYVILVGKSQTKPIYDGLIENKFKEENIFITNDVREAFPKINEVSIGKPYVLLENDLPDLFNEKN